MEGNRPQSFLEIGHATQLLLSSARPEMVMVAGRTTGSASPEQGGWQQQSAPQQVVTASQVEVYQGISPVTSGNFDESVKTVDQPTSQSTAVPYGPSAATSTTQPDMPGLSKKDKVNRAADWVANLPPEAATAPARPPPIPSPEASGSVSANTSTRAKNPSSAKPVNMGKNTGTTPSQPHRERYRSSEDSAIRGNFIPLSTSSRQRSPSPRRDQGPQGVYLQLSLTDSQMDRLTAALSVEDSDESFSRGRDRQTGRNTDSLRRSDKESAAPSMRARSPAKIYQSTATPSRTRSRSPVKFSNVVSTSDHHHAAHDLDFTPTIQSPSKMQETRFAQNLPTTQETPTRTTERGNRGSLPPIDTDIARAHARAAALRGGRQPAIAIQNPPGRARSPVRQNHQYVLADDASSFYSQDSSGRRFPSCISPLRICKESDPGHISVLQSYMDQRNSSHGSSNHLRESDQRGSTDEASSGGELQFTPLAPFLPPGIPTARKASKTLIGEGGWLENTSKPTETTSSPTRSGGFLGNLVKKAKEMIEAGNDSKAQRRSRESDKSRPASRQLAISLNPREQSLLYCEFEFVLTTALNDYITTQFNSGRLEADKLRKVADDWQRKGRPKVVGFRYDIETQLDLVRMHVNDFKFYSRVAATTAILAIIDTMKANARVLRVRTYCQPDTVVAKQLLDSQSLFNILGAPEEQHIKLAEIIAFFKAAIERERLNVIAAVQQASAPIVASATTTAVPSPSSPLHQSKSPRQGGGWWGTTGQLRQTKSYGHGFKMDPAGYGDQSE